MIYVAPHIFTYYSFHLEYSHVPVSTYLPAVHILRLLHVLPTKFDFVIILKFVLELTVL